MEFSSFTSNEVDDDEVVYETNVFLSKTLQEKLTLLHYPSKTSSAVCEDQKILAAKIKPKQQRLEIEVGLNVHSDNYDRSKGEQMAYNVDGQGPPDESFFNGSVMDKYVLFGTNAMNENDSYAVGLKRKGEMHITPLHSVMEINPEFIHMDKMDVASKKAQNLEEEEMEEEAVAVTVRFEGPNATRDREMREKSYQVLQQKSASEPWVNLNYHKIGSHVSVSEHEKLICCHDYRDASSETISPKDYLKELVPECLRLSGYQIGEEEDTVVVRNVPLSDKINRLFINAQLLTYSMLLEKLSPEVDSESIERLVQQTAILVQGCWAVKSDLVYPKDTVSHNSGICSETLRTARDYVLWLFTKSKFITRKDVISVVPIPDEDFRNMISYLAVKTRRGWEFKFPFDEDFIENHPTIAQSQEIKWSLMYKKIVKTLGMGDLEGELSKVINPGSSRPRQKRNSRSSVSEGDESGADPTTGGNKDKSPRTPKKRTAASPSKPGSRPRFQMATLDVSPTFLETPPPESLKSELRDYIGDAVRQQFCMKLADIKELLHESHLCSVLNRSDFEPLLEEALSEYGVQKMKNKWPQNTVPETLFAFTKYGNKLDRYRAALLDLFCTTARTRNNLFVKKVEDELREIISDNDCRQVFEEYCIYKSGFYYLKGTIAPDT